MKEEDLQHLRSEVNYYKRKCSEMKNQSNELNDCLHEDLESTNKSLVSKIDYLKPSNAVMEKEIRRSKKHTNGQKNRLKILKEKNSKYTEQVNATMFRSKQMAAKVEITRLQLEKHLSKYKARRTYLEKCARDMESNNGEQHYEEQEEEQEEEEDLRDESSFNDSGVPPEDFSDN